MADDNFFIICKGIAAPQYTDRDSHANMDVSFFRGTTVHKQFGKYAVNQDFGQRPVQGYPGTADVYPVLVLDAAMAVPVGGGSDWWAQVWNDGGSGRPKDYTCWKVRDNKIPQGYVCLSPCFFKVQDSGRDPPSAAEVSSMVLVRQELVSFVGANQLSLVWNDHGTHARQDVSIYTGPDSLGCFAFPNYDPPRGDFPVLKRSKGRLIFSWQQLTQAVASYTGGMSIVPRNIIGDRDVMSSNVARIQTVWNNNAGNFRVYAPGAFDCEDFAAEMRAAVARACHDDPVSLDAQVGCFCGVLYVLLAQGGGHGQNVILLPDETLVLFEPQNGSFPPKNSIGRFLDVTF